MPECQKLKCRLYGTWMALNAFKCNCLTPLHFKGLNSKVSQHNKPPMGCEAQLAWKWLSIRPLDGFLRFSPVL